MYQLVNEYLEISILAKGAELVGLYDKKNKIEYMWNADAAFWAKTSPILFPIVGSLKDNTYIFEKNKYQLPRHGFARDMLFEVEDHWDDGIIFLLKSTAETRKLYPFDFELRVTYELFANVLSVSYHVSNISEKPLYFSVGGHPAFAVPFQKGLAYNDFYLEFEKEEIFERCSLSAEGLILEETASLFGNQIIDEESVAIETKILPLTKELFYEDALVFKNLKSTSVTLKSAKTKYSLKFDFAGFPFLGIWAAKNANFVCIEPWCGIADSVAHSQELTEKEGIITLEPNDVFERAWAVKLN